MWHCSVTPVGQHHDTAIPHLHIKKYAVAQQEQTLSNIEIKLPLLLE